MTPVQYPSGRLTFVLRNEAPFIHMSEPCTYRTVRIELTPEQLEQVALRYTDTCGRIDHYEMISQIIMEPKAALPAERTTP